MVDSPLQKPSYLAASESWLAARPWGTASLGLGILAFLVCAITQGGLTALPDPRISVPFALLTAAAAATSMLRREPDAYPLYLLGLALAAAAIMLGWFLMIAIVIGVAFVLILILHAVM